MDIPPTILPFWTAFAATLDHDPTPRFYEAFFFADSEAVADELADLVLAGTKRATAGLAWSFEAESKPLPRPGAYSVLTNWRGAPLCVIETLVSEVVAFDDVSAAFAAVEGEGDGSLRYWRDTHWEFFARECKRLGRTPDLRMPVICEQFDVAWRP